MEPPRRGSFRDRRREAARRGRIPLRKPLHVPNIAGAELVYSAGEEIAHAATHGFGALLAIVGLTVLVARATLYGDAWHIIACSIFGATLVLMYLASALYHGIPHPRAKRVLRVIDHSLIFLLIAGTYTPFTMVTLRGPWGWFLFALTWGLAAAGIAFKLLATGRYEKYEKFSLAFYLGMGWCAVLAVEPLLGKLQPGGFLLMLAGGLTYTGGVAFYAMERLRYHHAIWHLFVLGGSVLHYFAVYFYVIPAPP